MRIILNTVTTVTPHPRRRPARSIAAPLVIAAVAVVAVGCAAPVASGGAGASTISTGEATEVAAPARALVIADEEGALTLLDLESESTTVIADGPAEIIDANGRFVHRIVGDTVEIIDTGRWSVPHGDHAHSFQAEPRIAASVTGSQPVDVRVGGDPTAVRFADGDVRTFEHEDLGGDGATTPIPDAVTVEPVGAALPFGGHLLVTTASAVEILDAAGAPTGQRVRCPQASGGTVTRAGAVIACADGAVVVTREVGGSLATEHVPHPAAAPAELTGRDDRPDLAGVAADGAGWMLDVRRRTWTPLADGCPLLRAVAVGDDDSRVVAVGLDGRVCVIDEAGATVACTEPLLAASVTDPALRDRVRLTVDAQFAYVTDPATGAVHELDHRDGIRLARTFSDLDPWYLQQVG